VDFPSSSPYVTSCGGTTLCKQNILCEYEESAFNDNRKNYQSKIFKKPKYQQNILYDSGTMRIVPDIGGVANPFTGYIVNSSGGYTIIGETGVIPPLWSALTALVNQYCGYNIGFLNNILYGQNINGSRNIINGSHNIINGPHNIIKDIITGMNGKYNAIIGWDPCTGLGSLIGNNMANFYNNIKPKTNFAANYITGYVPLSVTFTDKTKGYHNKWIWDFGDGNTSNLPNPTNIYNNIGKYTVILKTANVNGSSIKKKIKYINVISKPLKPIAKFSACPVIGLVPLTVKFINESKNKPDKVKWDFGDNIISEQYNPTHIYTFPGLYTVKLSIHNIAGCDILIKENYIKVISDVNNNISCNLTCC
jgi:PKD repeat protein